MNHIIRKFLHVQYMKAQGNKLCSFYRTSTRCSSSPIAQVKSPCLMLPAVKDKATGEMQYRLFNLADRKIIKFRKSTPLPKDARCFWSSQNWLAFIDPSNCQLYLWNPFLSYSNPNYASNGVIRLPSVETLRCILGVTYKDTDGDIIDKFKYGTGDKSPQKLSEYIIRGLAFSSPPSPSTDNNDCTVMAIEGIWKRLAYCKLGDTAWTYLEGPLAPYQNITYSINHQLFYAMGFGGGVEAWDLRDFSCVKRIPIDNYFKLCGHRFRGLELALRKYCQRKCYLVESLGDLLMVATHVDGGCFLSNNYELYGTLPYQTLRCDVYKLDNSVGRWNYTKSLGDRAIFVGLTDPFIVRAQDYPGVTPNSIYFADDEHYYLRNGVYSYDGHSYEGHNVGMFNLDNNRLEPFYPFGRLKSIKPPPFWVVPNLHPPENVER